MEIEQSTKRKFKTIVIRHKFHRYKLINSANIFLSSDVINSIQQLLNSKYYIESVFVTKNKYL